MASSAWAIRVGVDLDTSDIQSQLDKAAQGTKTLCGFLPGKRVRVF